MQAKTAVLLGVAWCCAGAIWAAAAPGRIEGKIVSADGSGIDGVVVLLEPVQRVEVTDDGGVFTFGRVPAGEYSLNFTYGAYVETVPGVVVEAGQVARVDRSFDWAFTFIERITVATASLKPERLVDAPAAITALGADQIELRSTTGQLPNLFRFTAGAEPTQSDLYDFNLSTRGLNSFLSRRVQVIVDGRDPSIPATSSQQWWALSFLLTDLASAELLRGPSAALYGPNSVSGVLNLRTRPPRDSQGIELDLIVGELDMLGGNLRWASGLGSGWYAKLLAHHTETDSFSVSRNRGGEYPGLPPELVELRPEGIDFDSLALRLDHDFPDGDRLTFEVGGSDGHGDTQVTSVGRFQELDIRQTYARVNFNSARWNAAYYHNSRDGDHIFLTPGAPLINNDSQDQFEFQANSYLLGGRLRVVGGLSYGEEKLDSADLNGIQTLYSRPIDEEETAVFVQLDFEASDKLKLVGAVRWDDSTLFEPEISPKASLVYQATANHTVRLGYNQAFQVGNYTEYFLSVPLPPLDLSPIEAALRPLLGGVELGLAFVPASAVGNENLEVENISSFELGYRGILGDRTVLIADAYFNEMSDFLSPLLPGVNRSFAPYRAPAGLDPAIAALVEATLNGAVPGLSNGAGGEAIFVVSFANTGKARSRGLELDLSHQALDSLKLDLSYSWFDLDVEQDIPGAEIQPNAPEHKASFRASYQGDRMSGLVGVRWVDRFDWSAGVFVGPVPSYTVSDLSLSYDLGPSWSVGLDVSNLFDDRHYEVFGGNILERRALARLSYRRSRP